MLRWVGGIHAALALLCATMPALADNYCIDQNVGTPSERTDWVPCGNVGDPTPCEGDVVYASVADALTAMAAAGGGQGPCIGTIGNHTETMSIDNSDGILGPAIGVYAVEGTNLCPDPASAAETPVFDYLGDPSTPDQVGLYLTLPVYDTSLCPSGPRPLVSSDQGVSLWDTRVVGASGAVVTIAPGAVDPVVVFYRSRIEGGTATLVEGPGSVQIGDCEVSGNVVDGGPLIQMQAGYEHELGGTALFGNVVSGGHPLVEIGGELLMEQGLLAGNVVLDGGDLLAVDLSEPGPAAELVLSRSVFSRNKLLDGGTVDGPTAWPRPLVPPEMDDVCLPHGSDQLPYADRADVTVSGAIESDAALIAIDGGVGSSTGLVALYKSFVVGNEWGAGGAVVRTSGELPDLQLLLVHDTVGDQPGLLVDGGGTGPGPAFGSARNLLLGDPVVALGAGFDAVDASMDQVESGTGDWLATFDTFQGLRGPAPPPPDWSTLFVAFADPNVHVARALAMCPNLYGDTSGLFPGGGNAPCALDRAANYVPGEASRAELAVPWPWRDTILPGLPPGDLQNTPGATGWTCDGQLPLAWDQADVGFGPDGDGDGYSSLVDCDNGSDATVPELPPNDGYSTSECDHFEDDCYLCPDEFGDDDDSGQDDDDSAGPDDDDSGDPDDDDTGSDDDDSAEVDDDDDTGDDDDSHDEIWDDTGCDAAGCGYSWQMGGLVVLLPLVVRRRR